MTRAVGPDELLWVDVVMHDVLIDGCDQLLHAGEYAAAQAFGGDVTEEPLDHVQPRGRGRCEVQLKTRVLVQSLLHGRMLMGRVVVHDQMQRFVAGCLAINLPQ